MTQNNTLNLKLFNSQFNKLKSGIKNSSEASLNISSNFIADFNDENNFLHKLLLTNTQVLKLGNSLAKLVNNSLANKKLSQTQEDY